MRRNLGKIWLEKFGKFICCLCLDLLVCWGGNWSERITVRGNRRRTGADTLRGSTMTYIPQYAVQHTRNTLQLPKTTPILRTTPAENSLTLRVTGWDNEFTKRTRQFCSAMRSAPKNDFKFGCQFGWRGGFPRE